MRSPLLFAALVSFAFNNSFAQQAYERTYPTNQTAYDYDVAWSPLDHTYWYAITDGTVLKLNHLDSTGLVIATSTYTGISAYDVDIEQSVNGNIYLCGSTFGSLVSYYVLALDFSGAVLWTKNYEITAQGMYGQPKLRTLDNGNLMIIESVYGHLGYIETDGNGNVIHSEALREDTTVENKTPGFAGDVYDDGSFVFTGKRGNDIVMVHTDNSGDILWTTVMNSGMAYYHTKSVAALSDGSALACGFENYNAFIMKTDANGVMQWYNSYSGQGTFYDIEVVDDSTFITSGTFGADLVISRFDMNGNELSTVRMTYPGWVFQALEVNVNPYGTCAVPFDFYCATSNAVGLLILEPGYPLGCGMSTSTYSPSTSSQDPSVLAVPFYVMPEPVIVTFPTVTRTINAVDPTGDVCTLLSVTEAESSDDFSLQNSPAQPGQPVTFTFNESRGDVSYSVTDVMGREVLRFESYYNGGLMPITGSDQLARGMYVVSVMMGERSYTEKFVIR